MSKLFESAQVKPVIEGPYKLEDVPEAFRIFEGAGTWGKWLSLSHVEWLKGLKG